VRSDRSRHHFHKVSLVGAVLCGCSATTVPHQSVDRTVPVARVITFHGLPAGARVALEGGSGKHVPLVTHAQGTATVPVVITRREHVEDGVARAVGTDAAADLSVQAPGLVPRIFHVTDASPDALDAHLDPPARASWRAEDLGMAAVLVAHPKAGMASVIAALTASRDEAGVAGVRAVALDVGQGRLDEAAHIASMVAEPLPYKQAALVLRMPTALLAEDRLRSAAALLREGSSARAFALASAAHTLDPEVRPEVYESVKRERIASLVRSAQTQGAAGHTVFARAFWLAAEALAGSAPEIAAGLRATDAAAVQAVGLRIALVQAGGGDAKDKLGTALAAAFPRYVTFVPPGTGVDAALSYTLSDPVRTHKVTKALRSAPVVAGTVTKPNPAYADARNDLQQAREELEQANESYNEFHEQANNYRQQAAQGGIAGSIAAGSAVAAEATGIGILTAARNKLNDAQAKLNATPQTTQETVTAQARYPVISLETTSRVSFACRLDGLGAPLEDRAEVSAQAKDEEIAPDPGLKVAGHPADVAKLATLAPETGEIVRQVAERLAAKVRAADEGAAWTAFVDAKKTPARGVIAAVRYLTVAPDGSAHRPDVVDYLVRTLP
jgi:hypothetical protein